MIRRTYLIAMRECRAYTATVSFWIALLVGPLALAGAFALLLGHEAAPANVARIVAESPALAQSAAAAVRDAARLEGRPLRVLTDARPHDPAPVLTVRASERAGLRMGFSEGFPLSPEGRGLVIRAVERDEAARAKGGDDGGLPLDSLAPAPAQTQAGPDAAALSRLGVTVVLWLALTGSLGMLLQAVVRERGNKALESLLTSVRPVELVLGKLLGVGAVSALVVGAWLVCAAGLSTVFKSQAASFGALAGGLNSPLALVRVLFVYGAGYAFYGAVTVAVGAAARDSTAAQNLARPMFAVLLAAFFVVLKQGLAGSAAVGWLSLIPPLAPFTLLLAAPEALSWPVQAAALAGVAASAALAIAVAVRVVAGAGAGASAVRLPTSAARA